MNTTGVSAYGWSGRVSDVGCAEAGRVIQDHLLRAFTPYRQVDMADYQASAEKLGGGQIRAGGWLCHYDRYSRDLGGWSLRCERDGKAFTWTFAP